jgi:surfeit locus 1 family protein
MIRRIPMIPTLIVLAAVAVMVRLGFWQLDRLGQKEALIERLRANAGNPVAVAYPSSRAAAQPLLYRRSKVDCSSAADWQSVSGRNAQGQDGWVHIVRCPIAEGRTADVVAGWSPGLTKPQWTGGEVTGYISPGGKAGTRLVADPPLAGLIANARPDPSSLSNNHLSYAVQWFLFALTALVIYALALRKRLAAPGDEG